MCSGDTAASIRAVAFGKRLLLVTCWRNCVAERVDCVAVACQLSPKLA